MYAFFNIKTYTRKNCMNKIVVMLFCLIVFHLLEPKCIDISNKTIFNLNDVFNGAPLDLIPVGYFQSSVVCIYKNILLINIFLHFIYSIYP